MSDKTFGELFWSNVDKMLEENEKGLKDISRCFYLVISVDGFKYDVPMMDLKDDECILEIKGNVHENPELLEDV